MGIAVFAGMIGVTVFGIFLTPVFYVLLRALTGNRPLKRHGETSAVDESPRRGRVWRAARCKPLRPRRRRMRHGLDEVKRP